MLTSICPRQGQHSNFISVTSEESTAQKLVSMSPISYKVSTPETAADVRVADLVDSDGHQQRTEDDDDSNISGRDAADASSSAQGAGKNNGRRGHQGPSQSSRGFRLDIFPAPEYNHQYAMQGRPEHHAWPVAAYEADRSFASATLKQVLPDGVARKGLTHWLVDMGTVSKQGSKGKRLQLKNWLPSKMRSQ